MSSVTVTGGHVQVGDHNEQRIVHPGGNAGGLPVSPARLEDPHGAEQLYTMKSGRRFRPLNDHVVIRPEPVPDKIGRILLPPSAMDKMKREIRVGTVMAMGKGMPTVSGGRWPMPDVKAGDRVYFFPDGALRIELDGEEFLSLRDDFVFAERLEHWDGGTSGNPVTSLDPL